MKRVSLLLIAFLVFVGCANTQEQNSNSTTRPKGIKVRTASYSTECRNCMAKFKITLNSQKFTKELLYKTCPSCKRD